MSKNDVAAGEQQWLDAFNGGDASAVAKVYTAEARLLPPNTDIVEGRSDIESYIKEFIQTGAKLTFESLAVHETPNMCAAIGRYRMDFPEGSGIPQDRGKFIEVWKRQSDGSWLVADDIFNSDLPAPPS
jgi:uncharacterized protein (TIGR02246 family)